MNAKYPWQLHISRQGVVRDRSHESDGPTGPVLGRVVCVARNLWEARTKDDVLLGKERRRADVVEHIYRHARRMEASK